tara:strand:+ start:2003 stop:2554 length:552 start_codon:yes stop_codon:yes gene_type:complete
MIFISGCSNDGFNHSDFKVEVKGNNLMKMPKKGTVDPAIGINAPEITGISFEKQPIQIRPSGKFTIILFLAHWCQHCRSEVDMLGPWIIDNPISKNLDFISVATSIDNSRPNYPPDIWLNQEDWPVKTIVDDIESSIGKSFGITSFPTWIILDEKGKVYNRFSGSITTKAFVNLTTFLSEENN